MKRPICKYCNIPMRASIALRNLPVFSGDFVGDNSGVGTFENPAPTRGQTFSYLGPAIIVKAWKCSTCGYSRVR